MDYDELGTALLRVLFWRCLLPLILMALVWLIIVSREVIKDVIVSLWQGIQYLVTFIWKAHLAVGTAVVTVVRDRMVAKFWQDDYSSRAARVAIVLWLTAVPVVLAFGLLVMAALFWLVVLSGLSAKNNGVPPKSCTT